MKQLSIRLPDDVFAALSEWGAQQNRTRGDLIRSLLERDVRDAIATGEYKPTTENAGDTYKSAKRVLDYLFTDKKSGQEPENVDIFNFAEYYGYAVGDIVRMIDFRKRRDAGSAEAFEPKD